MKTNFNEWITQNKEEEFSALSSQGLGMRTREDTDLIEGQLDQWVNKLMGLLNAVPQERKQKFLEKVISNIKTKF